LRNAARQNADMAAVFNAPSISLNRAPWSVEELFVVIDSADQKLALMLFCLLPVMLRHVEHDTIWVLELGLCIYSRKRR